MISSPSNLLLAGDFNFHVDDRSDGSAGRFRDLLNCFNLYPHDVQTPTHKDNHVLDLIITKSEERFISNLSIHDPIVSDHFAVHCNLAIDKPPNLKNVVTYRKLRSVDSVNLKKDISESSLCLEPASDLIDLCNQYDTVLSVILDNHAPP